MDLQTKIAFVKIRESYVIAAAKARLPIHSVNLRHNKGKVASRNLCQYRVSGKEFGYKQKKPAPAPKIKVRHTSHTPHLSRSSWTGST